MSDGSCHDFQLRVERERCHVCVFVVFLRRDDLDLEGHGSTRVCPVWTSSTGEAPPHGKLLLLRPKN